MAQLQKFRAGYRGQHFDDIAGMRMRPMSLSLANDADVTAVAAYVASLAPLAPVAVLEGGDAAQGPGALRPLRGLPRARRRRATRPCSGPRSSTRATGTCSPSSRTSRPACAARSPGDTSGALMRPMSMTLADEQAMRDVIAYITTLAK